MGCKALPSKDTPEASLGGLWKRWFQGVQLASVYLDNGAIVELQAVTSH